MILTFDALLVAVAVVAVTLVAVSIHGLMHRQAAR